MQIEDNPFLIGTIGTNYVLKMNHTDKQCIQRRIWNLLRKKWFFTIVFVVALCSLLIYVLEVKGFKVVETFSQFMRILESLFPKAFEEIVAILGAIFTFIVGRFLYGKLQEPKLEIIGVSPLSHANEKYWRVIVRNSGRTAAENCTGSVRLFGTYANGNMVDIKWGVCWSPAGNPHIITINVEEEQSLDVYRVATPQPTFQQFQVPTEKGWEFTTNDRNIPLSNFASPANLQLEIHVTAKNAKRCEKIYSLDMQQNDIVMSV